jgi:hypothetical protein
MWSLGKTTLGIATFSFSTSSEGIAAQATGFKVSCDTMM